MIEPPYNGFVQPSGTGLPPNPNAQALVGVWGLWGQLCGDVLQGAINDLQNLPFTPPELVL